MKILLDIAARLESRAKGGADTPDSAAADDALWLRGVWAALAAEIRAAVLSAEAASARTAPYAYQAFNPQDDLLSLSDLNTIQRVGRDEKNNVRSIDLRLHDTIINGYRWLLGERINDQRRLEAANAKITRLEARLAEVQKAMTFTPPTILDRCPGNCSRGGDGPPCGKPGCQG